MTDDLKARLRCDVNERDNLGRRKNWTEQRSERREAADRIEALEAALETAAIRLGHLAGQIEASYNISGTLRAEQAMKARHMSDEARAALAGGGDE